MQESADFYSRLPIFDGFASIVDPSRYQPVPDDWLIGLADVVRSTEAIEIGSYKAVNTAGAAVIAAVTNALQGREIPFVFGGDGASFALSAGDEAIARAALATTAAWVRDELGLELRVALVPVAVVREQGLDLRVARFAPSPNVSYAMFGGGGLAWAERAMKSGGFVVAPAPPLARPDLRGLSCRWQEIPATHGVILSLLLSPVNNDDPAYRRLVEALLADLEQSDEVARPVPADGPGVGWPPAGLELEARASRAVGQRLSARRLRLLFETLIAFIVIRLGIKLPGFDAARYRREVGENSDFRKFDDGLRMTLDCTPAVADRIERRLAAAEADNIARFGLHRQASAIMTCIVPSISQSNHLHFIDGAAGGYALAARRLKRPDDDAAPRDVQPAAGEAGRDAANERAR
jgi:Protein of unknown function (DUF3095)